MYNHEIQFKQMTDHHNKLLKEAQNNRHINYKSPRKSLAKLLYKLAEMLEPKVNAEQVTSFR